MNKNIYLLLILTMQFGFAQKQYTFNLYTVYESVNNKKGDRHEMINFTDTTKNGYRLLIISRNDTVTQGFLHDYKNEKGYRIEVKKKSFETFDFYKDIIKTTSFSTKDFKNKQDCNRNKYYKRNLKKTNDTLQVETFTFYENKRKTRLKFIVKIETFIGKNSKGLVSEEVFPYIVECIDTSYQSKFIKSIETEYYSRKKLFLRSKSNHITTNTTNFSINIKE